VKSFLEFWKDVNNLFSKLYEWKIFIKDITEKNSIQKNTTVESYRCDILNDIWFTSLGATFLILEMQMVD
jgi:hypothetical protein